MNTVAFQLARICVVIALVCVAAALATPKGRLPLALRGLAKMLGSCDVEKLRSSALNPSTPQPLNPSTSQPSAGKRVLAFILVLLAILLSLI